MLRCLLALMMLLTLAPLARAETKLFTSSPLLQAVEAGNVLAAQAALMGSNIDVNETVRDGLSLLMFSAKKGNADMVRLLVSRGANTQRTDNLGNTALIYATMSNSLDTLDELLKAGAQPNIANRQGTTPLMIAAQQNDVEMVKHLLKAGADPDQADYGGKTARDWATESRNRSIQALLR